MKKNIFFVSAVVALCFFYTGSVYMAQYYRLMTFYDDVTIDIITSVFNYILQDLGIAIYIYGFKKRYLLFSNNHFFVYSLIIGSIFMSVILMTRNPIILQIFGYLFNLSIGINSAFYLTLFTEKCPEEKMGLFFGLSYALGSIGTYLLSLIDNGEYITSSKSIVLYFLIIALIIYFVLNSENIKDKSRKNTKTQMPSSIKNLVLIIILMTTISCIGSGLYYSLPQAQGINWYLIRAFYSIGLIIAGLIMDKNSFMGEICVVASLTYPLIATSLFNQGMTDTITLSLSYIFRGFITIYYVLSFSKLYKKENDYLLFSSLGLLVSRLSEAIITIVLMKLNISNIVQLIFSAICFIPLLFVFVKTQNEKYVGTSFSETKRMALFCEKYELTNREKEILELLVQGLSDLEISSKLFISNNTVRFHISNLLKKTNSKSRIDVVNALNKM